VAQAVETALLQCNGNAEVIVYDDGSIDGTLATLRQFEHRIQIDCGPNRGANYARNRLLELANADWIQYLDADDYLLPSKISGQLAEIDKDTHVDVLYGPVTVKWHRQVDVTTVLSEIPEPHDPWAQLALWHLPQTGAPLFRRQALIDVGRWREDQQCCQEHELYLRLLIAGKRFRYADAGGAVYQRFETGTLSTTNVARVRRERLKIEDRLEQHLREAGTMTLYRQWAINQARFEIARVAWHESKDIAFEARAAIRRSGARFVPKGIAAPAVYRAVYRLFGFSVAEYIADRTRLLRTGSCRGDAGA
jgi:glycosyltransferase involved in cell wall biosynthesis